MLVQSGDKVGIFTDQTDEKNLLFTISDTLSGAMTNESKLELYPLYNDTRTYYAYYPYGDYSEYIPIDLSSGYSTPLLWATNTTNETTVKLQFTHMLPKVTFNLTAGGADVSSYDATATLKGAYSSAFFYLYDEDSSSLSGKFSSQASGDITLSIENGKITAYLIPMEDIPNNVKLE